jgi:hypothetical protein
MDGKLTLFKRPDSHVWWARFINKRVVIRTSTKTTDIEAAKKMATNWFYEKQLQIRGGIAPTTKAKSFQLASDKALHQYNRDVERGARSKSYIHGLTKVYKTLNQMIGNTDLTSINQASWFTLKSKLQQRKQMSDKTLHQYKNALTIVLKQAVMRGDLLTMPIFMSDKTGNNKDTPRTWFQATEYETLIKALRANITNHKQMKTRWIQDAEELKDYVLFVANTGMRVGEAMNVRFCDVEIDSEKYLKIRNILGKRGRAGVCKSYFGAVRPFTRCMERHNLTLENYSTSEQPIFAAYHRDMFREVLRAAKLYQTNDRPPRKRDLASMRSTYICYRLMNGVPVYDIANNCRTSVTMIEKHYAKYLDTLDSKTINKSDYNLATED